MTQISSVKVTRTIIYSPETYLEYCAEYDEQPTQEGFLDFISDWIDEDFRNEYGNQIIEPIES